VTADPTTDVRETDVEVARTPAADAVAALDAPALATAALGAGGYLPPAPEAGNLAQAGIVRAAEGPR